MSRGILVRNPVGKLLYTVVSATPATAISTTAYTEITAATPVAFDALEVYNSTGALLILATGAVGSEVDMPMYLMPGSQPHIIPLNKRKGTRLSVKAVDVAASDDGYIAVNLYG